MLDHVVKDGQLHGVGRRVLATVPRLDPARVAVDVCVLQRPDAATDRLFRERGIAIDYWTRGRTDPRLLAHLVGAVRRRGIDVLHLYGYRAADFGRVAAALTGRRTVVNVDHLYCAWYQRVADRLLLPWTGRVLAVSDAVPAESPMLRGGMGRRTVVVPNGVDLEEFTRSDDATRARTRATLGVAADELAVGYLGRLHPEKGLRYLVAAMPAVLAAVPHARLVLIGEGRERAALETQAHELGVADRVRFAGFRVDAPAVLSALDVAVLPSISEAFGYSLVEAMAVGTAVVGSDAGGIRTTVRDGETGLLVPPGDPDRLAAALVTLLTDDALRARLGAAGQAASRRFALTTHVAELEALYAELAP